MGDRKQSECLDWEGEPPTRSEIQADFDDVGDSWQENQMLKTVKNLLPFLVAIVAVVALILAIIGLVSTGDSNALSDSVNTLGSYFPGLVDEDGLAVRLASGDCEYGECDDLDSIYCTEKGAVRTFHQPSGHELLCVCNGQYWKCDAIGKFCITPPPLPAGGSFAYGTDCSNSGHSETCSFECSDGFAPSGAFTCTDGEWDNQHCACTAESLEDSLEHPVISDVEVCDLTAPNERCAGWSCAGTLLPAYNAEIECTQKGWDISEPLCVCQAATLFVALGIKGIDFVDVKNCDNTPAGEQCGHYDWNCPENLFKVGEMQCRYDGSWDVPDYPCVCGDEAPDIFGFDSACEYLHVGKSCDYDDWECEDDLIPITDLECTTDGLRGECGCSEEILKAALPTGSNADVSKCHKTPIHEECTDYICLNGFAKQCCNAPVCKDEGQWELHGDLCNDGCDPADLDKYSPSCGSANVPPGGTCPVTCGTTTEDPFACPGTPPCLATCLEDGTWDVPCVCNPDSLRKKVPFAFPLFSSFECQLGEHCSDIGCDSPNLEVVKNVECDPKKGFVGACGCTPLEGFMNVRDDGNGICGHKAVTYFCEDFCEGSLFPISKLQCCSNFGWVFANDGIVIDGDDLCGCVTDEVCLIVGQGCDLNDPPNPTAGCDTNPDDCSFDCETPYEYSGGEIVCDTATGDLSCPGSDCACQCAASTTCDPDPYTACRTTQATLDAGGTCADTMCPVLCARGQNDIFQGIMACSADGIECTQSPCTCQFACWPASSISTSAPLTTDGSVASTTYEALQSFLEENGYPAGGIDGFIGANTVNATRLFLNDNGADPQLVLDGANSFSIADIEAIQEFLNTRGEDPPLDVDGLLGPNTITALQIFLNSQICSFNCRNTNICAASTPPCSVVDEGPLITCDSEETCGISCDVDAYNGGTLVCYDTGAATFAWACTTDFGGVNDSCDCV